MTTVFKVDQSLESRWILLSIGFNDSKCRLSGCRFESYESATRTSKFALNNRRKRGRAQYSVNE